MYKRQSTGSVLENNSTIRVSPIQELANGNTVGGGTISGLEFRNRNLIEVDDSILIFANTSFDNSGGVLAANPNSDNIPSLIDITSQSELSGGVLRSFSNGLPISDADDPDTRSFPSLHVAGILRDVELEGNWDLNGFSFTDSRGSRGTIEGEITNNGSVQVVTSISTNGNVTFSGTGNF